VSEVEPANLPEMVAESIALECEISFVKKHHRDSVPTCGIARESSSDVAIDLLRKLSETARELSQ
jgi:hypothetical protein